MGEVASSPFSETLELTTHFRETQAKRNNVEFDPCLESHQVPLKVIREIAKEQGVDFRRGDIFILRTGQSSYSFLKAHSTDTSVPFSHSSAQGTRLDSTS